MKTKRAGLLTKIVVLALLIYMSITLLDLRGQIQQAESRRDETQQQVDALIQSNAALADVLESADDPGAMESIGRDQLGLARPDEEIYYGVGG